MNMFNEMNKESKGKLISFVISLVLTLMFAVPYFYYNYFYKSSGEIVPDSTPTENAVATIGKPAGEAFKMFKKNISRSFNALMNGADVYTKE